MGFCMILSCQVDAATFEKGPKDAEIFKVSLGNLRPGGVKVRVSLTVGIHGKNGRNDMGAPFVVVT